MSDYQSGKPALAQRLRAALGRLQHAPRAAGLTAGAALLGLAGLGVAFGLPSPSLLPSWDQSATFPGLSAGAYTRNMQAEGTAGSFDSSPASTPFPGSTTPQPNSPTAAPAGTSVESHDTAPPTAGASSTPKTMTVSTPESTPESTPLPTATPVPGVRLEFSGTVESIDGATAVIGGRTVIVDANTHFSDFQGLPLAVGQDVEVYGLVQADGSILATTIDLKSGGHDEGPDSDTPDVGDSSTDSHSGDSPDGASHDTGDPSTDSHSDGGASTDSHSSDSSPDSGDSISDNHSGDSDHSTGDSSADGQSGDNSPDSGDSSTGNHSTGDSPDNHSTGDNTDSHSGDSASAGDHGSD